MVVALHCDCAYEGTRTAPKTTIRDAARFADFRLHVIVTSSRPGTRSANFPCQSPGLRQLSIITLQPHTVGLHLDGEVAASCRGTVGVVGDLRNMLPGEDS